MRRILHVDMDAFYASVEQRDEPALRGQPVAVGGDPEHRGRRRRGQLRGARVRRALGDADGARGAALPVAGRSSARISRATRPRRSAVFEIFRDGDAAGRAAVARRGVPRRHRERVGRDARRPTVAQRLKAAIRETTGLTASAGVAPNKFLAKIASGWKKPDGLTVIAPERVEPFLQKLPVDALWGVGPVTARSGCASAASSGWSTCARSTPRLLRDAVGSLADWLRQLADGIDDRPVVPNRRRNRRGARTPTRGPDRPRGDPAGDRRDGANSRVPPALS